MPAQSRKIAMRWRWLATFWVLTLSLMPSVSKPSRVAATTPTTLSLTGGFVRVADHPTLNPSGGITLEAWVRRSRSASGCETLMTEGGGAGYWLGFCGDKIHYRAVGGGQDGTNPVAAG